MPDNDTIRQWLESAPDGTSRSHDLCRYAPRPGVTPQRWAATFYEHHWEDNQIVKSVHGWAASDSIDAALERAWADFGRNLNRRPYVVGNGLYCDEVGRYATFEEALAHYRRLRKPRPGEWRAIGLWNEDECDGATDGNHDGLTDEQREQF